METRQTYDSGLVLTSARRVVDLHSLEDVTVQPGEKVVIETDVTLAAVASGFRPVVASAREDLVVKPARRYRDTVRFGDDFSYSVRDVDVLAEEGIETDPDGKLYVIAENDGKEPVEVRLLDRVGLLGVEKWWNRGWVLRKAERIQKIGTRPRRRAQWSP